MKLKKLLKESSLKKKIKIQISFNFLDEIFFMVIILEKNHLKDKIRFKE